MKTMSWHMWVEGISYLRSCDTIDYLRKNYDGRFYSIAFRDINEYLRKISFLLTGTVLLIIVIVTGRRIYRNKKGIKKEEGLLNE